MEKIVFEVYNTYNRRVALFHTEERAKNYKNNTNKNYKILKKVLTNLK